MKSTFMVIVALSLILLAGCGPSLSLQPLWDAGHNAEEPQLVGKWTLDDSDWFEITQEEAGGYSLTYRNKEGISRYDGRLVRLGDEVYMDLSPRETSLEDAFHAQAYLPVIPAHFFVRMRLEADILRIGLLEEDKVEEILKGDQSLGSYQQVGDDVVLTGSTADLQRLLQELPKSDVWDESECKRK